jgi:predicted transcriptional regulator
MDAQVFIQKVAAGEAGDAKDTLTDMLSSKAFEALDARKQEIARTLYGETPDVEVQDTADSEVEEDELLTQEEFIALSDEDQELYLEALEQLDEIGDTPAGRQALGKYVKKRTKQLPQIEVGYQMAEPGRELKGYEKLKKKVNKGSWSCS